LYSGLKKDGLEGGLIEVKELGRSIERLDKKEVRTEEVGRSFTATPVTSGEKR